MSYGFLAFKKGARQQDGFFIDEENRILYWPDSNAPGYVLDEATAFDIAVGAEKNWNTASFVAGGLAFLLCIALVQIVGPSFGEVLSRSGSNFICAFIAASVWGVLEWPAHRRAIHNLRQRLVSSGGVNLVAAPRPQINVARLSDCVGWGGYLIGLIAIVGGGALFSAAGMARNLLVGDRVLFGLAALTMAALAAMVIRAQVIGVRVACLRFYRPLGPMPPALLPRQGKPAPRGLRRWLGLVFGGWKAPLWLLAFGGALLFGADVILAVPLTASDLLDQYARAAFPAENGVTLKWTKPVTICLGPSSEKDLRASIRQELTGMAEAGRLTVRFADQSCDVAIAFQPPPGDDDGVADGMQVRYSGFDGGALDHVDIFINPEGFRRTSPGSLLGLRGIEVERISATVGFWAFGLSGGVGLRHDSYRDRQGRRLPRLGAIVALHYDDRISPGAAMAQALAEAGPAAESLLNGAPR